MNHRKTYMHINFQQNWVSRSVKTVHTNLFAQYRKLHKFATTNSNFEENQSFWTCIIIKHTCIHELSDAIKTWDLMINTNLNYKQIYINFQQNRVKTQVVTVLTSLFAKKLQVA